MDNIQNRMLNTLSNNVPYYKYPVNFSNNNFQTQSDFSPDHVYFNVEITNSLPISSTATPYQNSAPAIPARYIETLTQPIIADPSQYYITIARFSIPGQGIPLIVFPTLSDSLSITPYVFCLTYNGNDYPVNVVYFSTNNDPLPTLSTKKNTKYYYVYEYQHVISLFNIALLSSFNALKLANPASPQTEAPFLIFNSSTQLISMVAPVNYNTPGDEIQIFSNNLLYNRFFVSMLVQYFGHNQTNGKDFLYLFPPTSITTAIGVSNLTPKYNDLFAIAPPSAGTQTAEGRFYTNSINNPSLATSAYTFNSQNFVALQYWNSFKNIVFTTTSIPIRGEYIPQNNTTGNQGEGIISFRQILTDFQPSLSNAGDSRSQLQYYPQGPYRLVDLVSNTPIQKIDIQVWWQDTEGDLHSIDILNEEVAGIKLLFIKKTN